MGPNGRSTAEHFGVEKDTDLIMGTFSKSFASLGGFIAGEGDVIDYIKHNARALIFSASMPPSAVATVLAALDIMEKEPQHRENLWKNVRKMQSAYRDMGFNIGGTQSPVVPIIIGDFEKTLIFWKERSGRRVRESPSSPGRASRHACSHQLHGDAHRRGAGPGHRNHGRSARSWSHLTCPRDLEVLGVRADLLPLEVLLHRLPHHPREPARRRQDRSHPTPKRPREGRGWPSLHDQEPGSTSPGQGRYRGRAARDAPRPASSW